jgi:hypothetical protein
MLQYIDTRTVIIFATGGLFPWILAVVILYIQKNNIRKEKSNGYKVQQKYEPGVVGDIEAKLENDGFGKPNIVELLARNGLQPLFILSLAEIVNDASYIYVGVVFVLLLLILLHEFYWSEKYSKEPLYLIGLLVLWLGIFAYTDGIAIKKKNEKPIQNQENTNTLTEPTKPPEKKT